MLCSIGHGEIPNLNFRFAPSCHCIGLLHLNNQSPKQNIFYPFNLYNTFK